jgi:hypothetical protein
MTTNKCLSYINQITCDGITDGKNWCTYCAKILVPLNVKYKKLEAKYEKIEDLNSLSFSELIKMYADIGKVADLRTYVSINGFIPEMRDEGHAIKIQMLKELQSKIEQVLSAKQSTPILDDGSDSESESEEIQSTPPMVPTKMVKNEVVYPKKIQKNKKEEILTFRDSAARIYSIIIDSLLDCSEQFLDTKFGNNFVRAFILQQKAINSFCQHGRDIAAKRIKYCGYKKPKSPPKKLSCIMSLDDIKHRYITHEEVMYEITKEKFMLSESDSEDIMGRTFTDYDLFNYLLILYEHLPQIPLPEHISWIKYDVDEKMEFSEEVLEGYASSVKFKLDLLRTKKAKNIVCLNNCLRATKLGEIGEDEELATYIFPVPEKKSIGICTSIKLKNFDTLTVYGEADIIKTENMKCSCSYTAIIKINRAYFNSVTEWDTFLQGITISSPYIFV